MKFLKEAVVPPQLDGEYLLLVEIFCDGDDSLIKAFITVVT